MKFLTLDLSQLTQTVTKPNYEYANKSSAPPLSPNFHQQPQFVLPQFLVPVPPVQNILADIHNKLSKLNCLDDILAKLSNLGTRFSNMEKTVHNMAEEVAKCKNNSETLEYKYN